jgi:hypothetical protein
VDAPRWIRTRLACISALAAAVLVPLGLTSTSGAAATKAITISGSIAGVSRGQVLILSPTGVVWSGVVHGTAFRIVVPSKDHAQLHDATVQVIGASGSYDGPVVLAKTTEKRNPACGRSTQPACIDDVVGLGKVTKDLSLGRLVGKDPRASIPTWFLASKASNVDPREAVRAATMSGRPYGAGNLGLVPGGIPVASAKGVKSKVSIGLTVSSHVRSLAVPAATAVAPSPLGGDWLPLPTGSPVTDASVHGHDTVIAHGYPPGTGASPSSGTDSESCPTTTDPLDASSATSGTPDGAAAGQELDCSGVPNALNVDVNGNDVLNDTDPAPASTAASVVSIGSTVGIAQQNAVSYYAPIALTPTGLATFLDPQPLPHQNPADFGAGIEPSQLFPGDTTGSDVTMTADCGTLTWCLDANLFSDVTNASAGPWSATSPPYALTPDALNKPVLFDAILLPPDGTDIPTAITPGQIITLNAVQSGTGATAQSLMEVGPYFASTPYIQGATLVGPGSGGPGFMTTDSVGNEVSASSTATVTLKIERPERLPLPGETTSSGLFDVSGLHYTVSISNPSPPGPTADCPASAYSNITGASVEAQPNINGGAVLDDNTTQDFDPAAAANPGPIELTVNLSACEAQGATSRPSLGYAWEPGKTYEVEVAASGTIGNEITSDSVDIIAPA